MPMVYTTVIAILLTISSIKARCPVSDSVKIYGHSGTITAKSGYLRTDRCEWKVFAPRQKRNYKIKVNIFKISCTKNLIIKGEDFCQHKPRISRTYIPNSCKEDCKQSSCRKIQGYPLVISYGKYADDHGFVIRFTYEPCTTGSTLVPHQQKTATTTTIATRSAKVQTTNAATNFNVTTVNVTAGKNATAGALESTTKRSSVAPLSSTSDVLIAAIVSPVAAVLVITVFLIITGLKVRKMKQQNETKKHVESIETMQSYIPTSNVTGAALYETLNKNSSAQTYTNETYQSLPMDVTEGKYAENKYDTVFQPTDTNATTVEDSQPPTTHIYEHVKAADFNTAEVANIEHQYDEVASETDSFDDCSSEDESRA